MFPAPTQRTAAVSPDLDASAVLLVRPAAAPEVEVASLLVAASAAVLTLTSTAIEVLTVLGVVVWVVALLVLTAIDASRAAPRLHMHQQVRNLYRWRMRHHFWVWR